MTADEEARIRGRGFAFTLREEIDLIRGFNTYGSGNWALIFRDSRLCFQSIVHRRREQLCPKWRNLRKKCIFREFFYLPGKKELCRPLPFRETGNNATTESEDELAPVI